MIFFLFLLLIFIFSVAYVILKGEIDTGVFVKMKRYLPICLVNLLVCVAIALTKIPYWGDTYGDSYFTFIRTWVLIINYAVHTPLLCLHFYLYYKRSKRLILSLIVHIAIVVITSPTSMFFWTYI